MMAGSQAASPSALALNDWWRRQRRWKTKAAAAQAAGMPASTFKGYFAGITPSSENRPKLYALTGLEIFSDAEAGASPSITASPVVVEAESKLSDVSETLRVLSQQFASLHELFEQLKAVDQPGRVVAFPQRASADERADEAAALVYRLIAVLDSFRSSAAERDVFRRRIHGPDVGYLASLATALLDEQKFHSWNAVSSYRPLGLRR